MCGVAGFIGSKELDGLLDPVVCAMRHRGPDDSGSVAVAAGERLIGLGSTRLAILDLTPAGRMPMLDAASGNRIVFNGEVYNFAELRRELESEGERFSSGTDTEVVLKGYRRWGERVLGRMRGMFAFGIWDQSRRELFLARDRLGEKPLYYHQGSNGLFLFASEVRALLASGRLERRLDREALANYLFNGFVISPLTAVHGVKSLLPGHWMRVSQEGRILQTTRYWSPTGRRDGSAATAEELVEELVQAVRLRLVSDVPLGVFLSGGLDSSLIVAMMAQTGKRARTVSVAFEEPDHDESAYAVWVARRFGSEHTELRLRREEFLRWFPSALDAMDQPTFDGVNTYCVARAARQSGLSVALTGLGADELFGGYPFFRSLPWIRRILRAASAFHPVPAWLAANWGRLRPYRLTAPWKLLEGIVPQNGHGRADIPATLASYQVVQSLFPWYARERILAQDHPTSPSALGLPGEFVDYLRTDLTEAGEDNAISTLALRLFLGERCLRDTDAMSMAVSLETRTAFTDHRFLESALRIGAARRCRGVPDKRFQWEVFRSCLGEEFPRRRKQGFTFPLEDWLRDPRALDQIRQVLLNRPLVAGIGLEPEAVYGLLEAFLNGRSRIPWSRIWALFVLTRWCERNRIVL